MMITITGAPCSGKSTVAKIFALKYGFEVFSTGNFVREMAKERGIDIVEMQGVLNSDPTIDKKIEEMQIQMGKDRLKDNIILESRLGWFCVPKAFSVYVTIPEDEMARRFLSDQERKNDRTVTNVQEAKDVLNYRKNQETERYKSIYGINLSDTNNYNCIVENYNKTPEQSADEIYEAYLKYIEANKYE